MLSREEIGGLIQLHDRAYRLLMWLDRAAGENPKVLAPEVAATLAKPATCGPWLREKCSAIPQDLLPEGSISEEFVNLFSSFFETSFHIEHVSLGGELLDSHLSRRSSKHSHQSSGYTAAQALALKHLARSHGIRMSEAEARKLVRRKSIQPHLLLWTYVWELGRRAKGKGKGEVVHRIWRSLPVATRKHLSSDAVWTAREEILRILCAADPDSFEA